MGARTSTRYASVVRPWTRVNILGGSALVAITYDGDNDDLFGHTGGDDFNWEIADVLENFAGATPVTSTRRR